MGRVTVIFNAYEESIPDIEDVVESEYVRFYIAPPDSKQNICYEISRKDLVSVVPYQEPVPDIPGTAIWANTKDDPVSNLDPFFISRVRDGGEWKTVAINKLGEWTELEDIAYWKHYKEHNPPDQFGN